MDEIVELCDEYLKQNKKLLDYMMQLQTDEKEYYRNNQEIIYVGLVNRAYSLWETFCKDLIFEYYKKIKSRLIDNGELVKKLKLNELPGYIVEEGTISENRITYELKRDFITYTSKNIGFDELKKLYSRFDICIDDLQTNKNIKDYLITNALYFNVDDFSKSYLKLAMKNLTDERNMVSHFSSIDQYQDLTTISAWVQLCIVLSRELSILVIKCMVENSIDNLSSIGTFVKYYDKKQVLCVDVSKGLKLNRKTKIVIVCRGKVKNIYLPECFMIEDNMVEEVNGNDKAGIKLKSIWDEKNNINKTDEILILDSML